MCGNYKAWVVQTMLFLEQTCCLPVLPKLPICSLSARSYLFDLFCLGSFLLAFLPCPQESSQNSSIFRTLLYPLRRNIGKHIEKGIDSETSLTSIPHKEAFVGIRAFYELAWVHCTTGTIPSCMVSKRSGADEVSSSQAAVFAFAAAFAVALS